jgi:hypothetical protein
MRGLELQLINKVSATAAEPAKRELKSQTSRPISHSTTKLSEYCSTRISGLYPPLTVSEERIECNKNPQLPQWPGQAKERTKGMLDEGEQ